MQEFRDRVLDDFGPQTLDEFVAQFRERQKRERTWAVYRGGELGGFISYEPWSPICGTSHCLFSKRFWGHETTVPALRAVYREIFAGDTRKVLSFVFSDNGQIVHLARTIGAVKEGVLRQQTQRRGQLVDMVALGLLKADFEAAEKTGREEAA